MPATMMSHSEKLLRYSRRGIAVLLGLVLTLGGLSIAMAFQPEACTVGALFSGCSPSTMTVGMSLFLALFLHFDRDGDGR